MQFMDRVYGSHGLQTMPMDHNNARAFFQPFVPSSLSSMGNVALATAAREAMMAKGDDELATTTKTMANDEEIAIM